MGSSTSSFNSATTDGIPSGLAGDRLDLYKKLSAKCSTTFPPEFKSGAQEGNVGSEVGNRALAKGQWASARRKKVGDVYLRTYVTYVVHELTD